MKGDGGSLAGGGRTDFWVPPDVRSAHPAERALYGVPIPPRRSLGRHQISVVQCTDSHAARGAAIASRFDRCSLTVRTCPPTPIEKIRRTAVPMTRRLCSRLRERPPHGEILMKGGRGILARGGRAESGGPPDVRSAHPASRVLYCVPTRAARPGCHRILTCPRKTQPARIGDLTSRR
jgi:hypothetical protein